MDDTGLSLACRFSYPPNSLSLCGPDKQHDLAWYAATRQPDRGTIEILRQFSTLYPYLCLIAGENGLRDPFDRRVIEAYWIGNTLLEHVPTRKFVHHLTDNLAIRKQKKRKHLNLLLENVALDGFPHHAFHVLNVYRRTGHLPIPHTVETMDACLVNWGTVTTISCGSITVRTKPLMQQGDLLRFGNPLERTLFLQGSPDQAAEKVHIGDAVSYHWGYFCQRLSQRQLNNLRGFTNRALRLANRNP